MSGIRPDEFDYDLYFRKTQEIIDRTEPFVVGETNEFLPVLQWTLGDAFGKDCRYRERMLELQLEGVTKTLQAGTDWVPSIEPWHGVGVFAEAFGCPFEWRDDDAPWTHPIVSSVDQLKALTKPKLEDCKMLQYVLETIRYFEKHTGGRVMISTTDTQSPLDTTTLILDTNFFFYAAMDCPDELHRVISDVTDLIIEFSIAQRAIISWPATPGHNSFCHPRLPGLGLSEDCMSMVGPEFFDEFARPYNERIAGALGGVAIHSCGVWSQNYEVLRRLRGLVEVDLAVDRRMDPTPNDPMIVRDGLRGSDFLVKARWPGDRMDILDTIYAPDLKLMWEAAWEEDPRVRQAYYDAAKRRFDELAARSGGKPTEAR